jgi:hypothetical protein
MRAITCVSTNGTKLEEVICFNK